jgi:hypothetical protein
MQWRKKKPTEESSDIHPTHKKTRPSEAKPTTPSKSTKPPKEGKNQPAVKPEATADGLSREDLEALREDAFAEMDIPFSEVLKLEGIEREDGGKLITPINPRDFKQDSVEIQNKFAQLGFSFMPSFYDIFISQILFISQEEKRRIAREESQPLPPHWDLAHIIVWRQAERQVRAEAQIAPDDKLSANDAQELAERTHLQSMEMWQQAEVKMLRRQAEKRLRREKGLRGDATLDESEIEAMIKKIRAEPQAKKK